MDRVKVAIVLAVIISLSYIYKKFSSRKKRNRLLERFRSNLKARNQIRRKLNETISNHLMKDPEINIEIKATEEEIQLREKANIHRARLSKYGRSKLNGIMFFQGERGGVYQLTKGGNKRYV